MKRCLANPRSVTIRHLYFGKNWHHTTKNRPYDCSFALSLAGGPDGLGTRDVNGNHKTTGGKLQHLFHLFARSLPASTYNLTALPKLMQDILAQQAGCESFLACEDFISAGRVRRNRRVVDFRQINDPPVDKITVDGELIAVAES